MERIRQAIEELPALIWAIDNDLNIQLWNKRCEEVTGLKEQEVVGKGIFSIGFFNDINFQQKIKSLVLSSDPYQECEIQTTYEKKDGKEGFLEVLLRYRENPVFGNSRHWSIAFDITSRVHLSNQLEHSERRFHTIAQVTNDAVWDWNLETDFLWWGPGMESQFGHNMNDSQNHIDWWVENIHPDDRDRVYNRINQFIANKAHEWKDEYRFRRKDGSYAFVMDRGIIIKDGTGKPFHMIGGILDITEKNIYEQDLVLKNQQLAEYAFFNSHKVRAPLVRLLACIQLIEITESASEANKDLIDLLENIKSAAYDLDEMVRKIGKIISDNKASPRLDYLKD